MFWNVVLTVLCGALTVVLIALPMISAIGAGILLHVTNSLGYLMGVIVTIAIFFVSVTWLRGDQSLGTNPEAWTYVIIAWIVVCVSGIFIPLVFPADV